MAADIENLVAGVTNMHLDGLPAYPFGHPNAGETTWPTTPASTTR